MARTVQCVYLKKEGEGLDFAPYPGGAKGTEGSMVQWMDALVHSLAKALGENPQ